MMNLKDSKLILNKINLLFENLMVDNSISNIERDLMLSYIRQFYDGFLTNNMPSVKPIVIVEDEVEEEVSTYIPEPIIKKAPIVETIKEVSYKKPVVIKIPDSLKEFTNKPDTSNQYQAPEPVVEPTPSVSPIVQPVVNQPTATQNIVHNPSTVQVAPELIELFELSNSNELSDRLNSLPIADLKKSIGLNEKILTINDLYEGDHRLFDKSLDILNTFSSFDEAKVYIAENLANKFDWTSSYKLKKAKIFIKLISRRYN